MEPLAPIFRIAKMDGGTPVDPDDLGGAGNGNPPPPPPPPPPPGSGG